MRRAMVGRRWSRRRSSHSVKIKSIVDESQSEPSCGPVLQPAPPPAPHPVQEGVGGVPGVDDDTALGNGTPTLGPAWQGTHTLQNPALGPGVGEGAPLARSVSLAIPIPLFICEHYSMAQHGAGHVAPCCPDPAMLPTGQQVLRARSCCLDHHLPLPAMPAIRGGAGPGRQNTDLTTAPAAPRHSQGTPTPHTTPTHPHHLRVTPKHKSVL
ncbi:hypothetical protein E2C01_075510 [Portunus trituberculatus]|uniref:Uncharacterized protein n=1 Tax=Portunus trituberculatus TaxID=210409 RepID=A0A5B7IF57_PORTR|nr:hypothetical protein [Portunus trituberculatus]